MVKNGLLGAKRSIAVLMTALILIGLIPVTAEAASFTDTEGSWAKTVIDRWSSSGYDIVNGYEDGSFRPQNSITRGEFAAILRRVMRYETTADNSFTDLDTGIWYYGDVLRVYAAGVTSGIGGGLFGGESAITREQAFTMLCRMFGVTENESGLSSFYDASSVSDWARGAVGGMVAAGYVQGSDGMLNPGGNLTRAEAVQVLDNIIKNIYSAAGTYTIDTSGAVIVNADGVTLENSKAGAVYVTQGIGADGDFTLKNSVAGILEVTGGGANSITIDNSQVTALTVAVDSTTGDVRIHLENGAEISVADVVSGSSETVYFTNEQGTVIGSVTISDDGAISVSGNVGELNVSGRNVSVVVEKGASIGALNIEGEGAVLDVAGKVETLGVKGNGATVETKATAEIRDVTLEASGAEITGGGKVTNVTVTESAGTGNKVTTPQTVIENNSGAPVVKDNSGGTVGSGETGGGVPSGGNPGGDPGGGYVITQPTGTAKLITNQTEANGAGLTNYPWDWGNQAITGANWMIFDYTAGNTAIAVTGYKVIKNGSTVVYDSGGIALTKSAGTAGRVGIEAADASDTDGNAVHFTAGTYKLELYYTIAGSSKTLTSGNITVGTDAEAAVYNASNKLIKNDTLAAALSGAAAGQKIELLKDAQVNGTAQVGTDITLTVPNGKTLTVGGALTVNGTLTNNGTLKVNMASGSITGTVSGTVQWDAGGAWELKSALEASREGDTIMITGQIGEDVVDTCVLHANITAGSGNDAGYYNFRVKKAVTITQTSKAFAIYGNFTIGMDNGTPVEGAEFIDLNIITPRLRFSKNPGSSKVLLYAIGGVTNEVTITRCTISTSSTVYSGASSSSDENPDYICVYRGISLVPTEGTAEEITYNITGTTISFDQSAVDGKTPLVSGLSGIAVMSSKYGNETGSNWTGRYPGVTKPAMFGAQGETDALAIYDELVLLAGNSTAGIPDGVDIAVWYDNGGTPGTCVVTRGSRADYNS